MAVAYSKAFIKQSKKLEPRVRQKLLQRLLLFSQDPLDPTLRNHALKGSYRRYRSIDITGDVRALYLQIDGDSVFDAVGTHSQLYG